MIRSERGFTIVEVIIASALLSLVALAMAAVLSSFYSHFARTKNTAARDRYMSGVLSMLEVRLAQMDISFDPNATTSTDFKTFPYYWSSDYDPVNKNDCVKLLFKSLNLAECPLLGRMNYLIKPISGVPNMYETTIYFYHPELNSGNVREYKYLLSVK